MSTEKHSINALDELGGLDERGKPVKARLKDVKSALGIYEALRKADEKSSANRARVDAMFDGANPYSPIYCRRTTISSINCSKYFYIIVCV